MKIIGGGPVAGPEMLPPTHTLHLRRPPADLREHPGDHVAPSGVVVRPELARAAEVGQGNAALLVVRKKRQPLNRWGAVFQS